MKKKAWQERIESLREFYTKDKTYKAIALDNFVCDATIYGNLVSYRKSLSPKELTELENIKQSIKDAEQERRDVLLRTHFTEGTYHKVIAKQLNLTSAMVSLLLIKFRNELPQDELKMLEDMKVKVRSKNG